MAKKTAHRERQGRGNHTIASNLKTCLLRIILERQTLPYSCLLFCCSGSRRPTSHYDLTLAVR